jgi:DNA-binding PadR family transcriptional regulator
VLNSLEERGYLRSRGEIVGGRITEKGREALNETKKK